MFADRAPIFPRMFRALLAVGWVLVAIPAQAGPTAPARPRPVNLLTAAPTVVAVSSTVANRAIVPAHLVDGDLATAWNSRTGELQGAWIGARVPGDARVTAIRMTVGFTKVDPKLGDLFTMNPRIRKVRVLRNGAAIAERALDPTLRTLQDIPIDQPGGEYKIEVVDVMPGTRPSWREISLVMRSLVMSCGRTTPHPAFGHPLPLRGARDAVGGRAYEGPVVWVAECEISAALSRSVSAGPRARECSAPPGW